MVELLATCIVGSAVVLHWDGDLKSLLKPLVEVDRVRFYVVQEGRTRTEGY